MIHCYALQAGEFLYGTYRADGVSIDNWGYEVRPFNGHYGRALVTWLPSHVAGRITATV